MTLFCNRIYFHSRIIEVNMISTNSVSNMQHLSLPKVRQMVQEGLSDDFLFIRNCENIVLLTAVPHEQNLLISSWYMLLKDNFYKF
jgi:hypothetical protein